MEMALQVRGIQFKDQFDDVLVDEKLNEKVSNFIRKELWNIIDYENMTEKLILMDIYLAQNGHRLIQIVLRPSIAKMLSVFIFVKISYKSSTSLVQTCRILDRSRQIFSFLQLVLMVWLAYF